MTQPSQYPEHDKLAKVSEISQEQGALLDWLQEQGVHLMRWSTWREEADGCLACHHLGEYSRERCRLLDQCDTCHGTHTRMVTREGWQPDGRRIEQLLADYHGIDQDKIEAEKRAMLEFLRAGHSGGAS